MKLLGEDIFMILQNPLVAGCGWLMLVILATEIRRIVVQSQPRQIVGKTLTWKKPSPKRAGGVAQAVGPEFKPQDHKNKQTNNK
jgi:hypothetical protein